ncbi:RNA polymerase subunit sigma-24 [Pseudoalteromonas sp. S1727]|uniref:RNA polymerase sigma factor n=1 Tax=Pseudoalteromonas sp. S1727 TaxID=2066514 RepID=UPI00110980A9|nr:RNA polymerase sigma factor [Pseudoalteromonas sp. S1727]TMN74787.1 RNA polymerase subunit sigma-24 [Pseudoalteromonas sp. S1727]
MPFLDFSNVVNIMTRRTGCRDKAQSLIQEAIARLLKQDTKQFNTNKETENRALILKTANNLLIDLYRREKVCQFTALPEEESALYAQEHLNPESKLMAQQQLDALENCIANLPDKCREAFVLYKFKCLSQAQIAEHMDISQSMVEKHLVKAMSRCREILLTDE